MTLLAARPMLLKASTSDALRLERVTVPLHLRTVERVALLRFLCGMRPYQSTLEFALF